MSTIREEIGRGETLLHRVNAVRAAQDYAMLSGYAQVTAVSPSGDAREYEQEGEFWRDALDRTPDSRAVKTVRLRGFRLSRWVPRVPGLYWKDEARMLREGAAQHRLPIQFVQGDDYDPRQHPALFSPVGKTLRLLGGVGNVRLLPTVSGCLLVASSTGKYWRGVPVLLSPEIWRRLGDLEEGTLADIRGVWTPMPRDVAQGLGGEAGLPRRCLVVGDDEDITLAPGPSPGFGSAWTLFERRDSQTNLPRLDFAYCVFRANGAAPRPSDIRDALEEDEAGEWLQKYVADHNGRALTDYDEQEPRLDPLLPISELMSREIEPRRVRVFLDGVKQQVFSPEAVNYDELAAVLVRHFSADDLAFLASDYLGIQLENLAGRNAPKAEQVLALVAYCREQRRLPELVVGVLNERPHLSAELAITSQGG
jgi:hypothetical protein